MPNLNAKCDNDSENDNLREYKNQLRQFYSANVSPKVGAVVMNCNPFTLGHRYLVERALEHCDKIIVFVVEEDKSLFPFADRISLVKENLKDLKDVTVIPSGRFIISSLTFSEYFNKECLQHRTIDTSLDITLFAKEIAPCMNITVRFAGEEPLDTVTAQYNMTMQRLLPQYGIDFKEIPRLKNGDEVISASKVRQLVKEGLCSEIRQLVPDTTFRYLQRKWLTKV